MKLFRHKAFVMVLFTLSSWAQSGKLKVTAVDYDKWGTLSGEIISSDGKWVSCRLEYQTGKDTLFIINSKTRNTFDFPDASSGKFSNDSKMLAIYFPTKRIEILNLLNRSIKSYSGVTRFDFLANSKSLMLQDNSHGKMNLILLDNKLNVQWQIDNVLDYKIGPDGKIALITPEAVLIGNTLQNISPKQVFKDSTTIKDNLVWSSSGNSLALFNRSNESSNDVKLMRYSIAEKKWDTLDSTHLHFNNQQYGFEGYGIAISDSDSRVYFSIIPLKSKQENDLEVEIWESTSILEYPMQELYKQPEMNTLLTVWDVNSHQVCTVDDYDLINSKILPGGKYALAQSRHSMVSQLEESPPADYYSKEILSDKKSLVVQQGSTSSGAMNISPSGRHICYFKNGDYHVFDNEVGMATNITAKISSDFNSFEFDQPGTNPGYYSPGWSADSRFVILYDQFDIWLVSPQGKMAKRITKGRESKTRYRLEINKDAAQVGNFTEFSKVKIDIQKGIVLTARNEDQSSGYYTFNEKDGLQKLVHDKSKFHRLAKARETATYIYVAETFASPPRLMLKDQAQKAPQLIFQSNKHYTKYDWPSSELISYQNSQGDSLQAILMYPAGYEIDKKYPMVVYIYERLSHMMYEYENPVSHNYTGFSPSTYLHDGYFVLLPDIKFVVGNPGLSAVDCVTSAVQSVKARGIIIENHIGLIGHSYGGYETSFITTQTPMFAAAVTGASINDPVSWYLTMNFNKLRSNNWSFESQQLRMGSSPFNNWDGYTRNSPIANAANITTPLLIWAGKDDTSVNVEQSIELHLALRRLEKPNTMLLYPGQGHILTDPSAQLHLTKSIKEWFDYYLKK